MPFSEQKASEAVKFLENLTLSEGEWAGKKLQLLPWQRQVVRDVFGTLNDAGTRQYRTVWIEIPKKNGKSGLTSGLALKMLLADGEPGPEVYTAAVAREQANVIFETAEYMVLASRRLSKMCKIAKSLKRITRRGKVRGTFLAVSADVDSKHGLKPSAVLIDELHAFRSRKLYDVLTKGSGAARRQPLVVIITTAGERELGIAWDLHRRAARKLKAMAKRAPGDPEPDPALYAVIYAADDTDDPDDEQTLLKANPSAAHFPSLLADLKKEWGEAKGIPIEEALFKQLHLNIWGTPTVAKWLHISVWDQNAGDPFKPEELAGRACYGGLDLSSYSDLTAWAMVFPHEGDLEQFDLLCRFWVPEAALRDERNPNQELYVEWYQAGVLQTTPGNAIDYDCIQEQILQDAQAFNLVDFNVDRDFQSHQITLSLQKAGLTPVPRGQGFRSYNWPMQELKRRLLNKKVRHGGNPIMRWMFENLEVERDAAGNIKPSKRKQHEKIDGIAALIMALERAMRHAGMEEDTGPLTLHELQGVKVLV